MTSLQDLRSQIDNVDREIVLWLVSGGGEKTLWNLVDTRLWIAKKIGEYKHTHQLPIIDFQRQKEMIASRVFWAPESHQKLVQQFFEVLHDISVRIQAEWKNLQKYSSWVKTFLSIVNKGDAGL